MSELKHGIRNLLEVGPNELSNTDIDELFCNISDDGESLNFHTFESFVTGFGDKVFSFHCVYVCVALESIKAAFAFSSNT